MIAIKASKVSKRFSNVDALSDLSLQVNLGDVLGLLGPNGAGKTTLISVFLGLVKPDSGSAHVLGIDPFENPRAARREVSYLPELVSLYPELTAFQNLQFFSSFDPNPRSSSELRACLLDVRLDERFHDSKAKNLSKGMCQKVGLAIALAKKARVVFLDEPWTGLDPESATELNDQICELRERGTTILLATHDIFHLSAIASHIGIVRSGHLLKIVSSQEMKAEEVEQLFLEQMRRKD